MKGSETYQFFLFGNYQFINDLNVFIGYLLNVCLGNFFFVLGNRFVFFEFFEQIIPFPTDIAYSNFSILTDFFVLFDLFVASFFRKRRHDQTYDISVIGDAET